MDLLEACRVVRCNKRAMSALLLLSKRCCSVFVQFLRTTRMLHSLDYDASSIRNSHFTPRPLYSGHIVRFFLVTVDVGVARVHLVWPLFLEVKRGAITLNPPIM